jgi:light-regulated signal transduction histidine kinase (bacteriophytochrome)
MAGDSFSDLQDPSPSSVQTPVDQGPEAGLDLSICDREPIHIPGSIQPHGFLLALDPATLTVRECSENTAGFLQTELSAVFGSRLPDILGAANGEQLDDQLAPGKLLNSPRLLVSLRLRPTDPHAWEVVAHRTDAEPGRESAERILVEFEPAIERLDLEAINSRLYNFISANRGTRETQAVIEAAVSELRSLTGCDRVVLYRFDEEGHGVVLAEERGEQFASYLGLRFPASDVPKQARRMYELNRVRIIPNVDYEPSPLVSPAAAGSIPALDLSASILRSVSPVHRAYMRNMGTACSMSVSILVEGALWGLVSCHHHEPRYVPLRLRSACDFVMQVVGSQIESQQNGEHLRRVLRARSIQARLLAAMAASEHYLDGLIENSPLLMELTDADGAAIVMGNTVRLFGLTPTEAQVSALTAWLKEDLFVSSRLGELYSAGAAFAGTASGVVAASLSKLHCTYVLWFRREVVATVRWAGDPQKPALPEGATSLAPGVTVSPRHSFEEWQQTVRGQSAPWSREAVAAVAEFRAAVLEIVLKRAEELAQLAAGLKVANEELEAFSYSVSHDLRAPFRHISGFSEMLREEEAGRMSEKGHRYLSTIISSARFAGLLVDSLLDFSRIARTQMHVLSFDMEQLVDKEWEAVLADDGAGRSIQFTRTDLPRVQGDPHLLGLVMRNLLANAVKYTGKTDPAIIEVSARTEGQEFIFAVKDNGVGFDQQYAGKLFGVFQRLHRAEDFEGTGIGLANVRRIVARHGGRTWAQGETGKGATFFFSLPLATVPGGE